MASHIIWPTTAVVVGDVLHQFSYSYTKFCSYLECRAEWKTTIGYIFQVIPIRDFLLPNCEMQSYTQLRSLKVPASYFKIIQHNKWKATNLKILYFWKYQSSRSDRLISSLLFLYSFSQFPSGFFSYWNAWRFILGMLDNITCTANVPTPPEAPNINIL